MGSLQPSILANKQDFVKWLVTRKIRFYYNICIVLKLNNPQIGDYLLNLEYLLLFRRLLGCGDNGCLDYISIGRAPVHAIPFADGVQDS